jgi:proteic killer suppression protein
VIRTFKCKETKKLFAREISRKLPRSIQRPAFRKLLILNEAEKLNDLRMPPSNHLEKLSGDKKGQYSIRINSQWRICFEWEHGYKYNVEIVDYH